MLIAAVGIVIMFAALACQITQLVVSIRRRHELRDETGDPWDGRSLEWATPSPPPVYNFAVLPHVEGLEPYWNIKQRTAENQVEAEEPEYRPIEMPRNTATGFVCAFFATITGFALIWHIWWLAILGLIAAYAVFVKFAWRDLEHYEIPAEDVARADREYRERRAESLHIRNSLQELQ
jgi:cytochrome o ubiquinol oxidase subunit 1